MRDPVDLAAVVERLLPLLESDKSNDWSEEVRALRAAQPSLTPRNQRRLAVAFEVAAERRARCVQKALLLLETTAAEHGSVTREQILWWSNLMNFSLAAREEEADMMIADFRHRYGLGAPSWQAREWNNDPNGGFREAKP